MNLKHDCKFINNNFFARLISTNQAISKKRYINFQRSPRFNPTVEMQNFFCRSTFLLLLQLEPILLILSDKLLYIL